MWSELISIETAGLVKVTMFTTSCRSKKTKHAHLSLIWIYAKTCLCDLSCADLVHIAHFVNKPDQSSLMLLAVQWLHSIIGRDAASIENKVQNCAFLRCI